MPLHLLAHVDADKSCLIQPESLFGVLIAGLLQRIDDLF
jgi:hypothetical protein